MPVKFAEKYGIEISTNPTQVKIGDKSDYEKLVI